MTRLRVQAGFTTIELLIAASLMLIVLTATLSSLDGFTETTRVNAAQNDSQQEARQAMGQLARELRNHAVANSQAPEGIVVASPFDLVFATVGRTRPSGSANTSNVQRVRYCLDGGTPAKLWAQSQAWTTAAAPPVPSTVGCPSSAWGTKRVVAKDIVNRFNGQNRALFTYDAATASAVRRVEMSLFVDSTPVARPKETKLESAIFLRNANRAPTAFLSASATGSGQVVLNGTMSTDPEDELLRYSWKVDGATIAQTSETVDLSALPAGNHPVELTVTDPGGLSGSVTATVSVP